MASAKMREPSDVSIETTNRNPYKIDVGNCSVKTDKVSERDGSVFLGQSDIGPDNHHQINLSRSISEVRYCYYFFVLQALLV